jgi:putative ABC transport system permease protein
MNALGQDLRYALRMLARSPGFVSVVVLMLGLGIGINTTVFSLVTSLSYPSSPLKDQGRIALVWASRFIASEGRGSVSAPDFADWRQQNDVFEDMAMFSGTTLMFKIATQSGQVETQQVSEGFFRALGVQPARGRTFLPEECQPGGHHVAILSDSAWRQGFGSDPGVLGQTIKLNREAYAVVGVMPPGFSYPGYQTPLWTPLVSDMSPAGRARRFAQVVARLKRGVTIGQAQADMAAIARRLAQAYPVTDAGWGIRVMGLRESMNERYSRGLLLFSGPVFFVLLIACANVANLLLGRASRRNRETAVRAALGAGRFRLIRQFLTESLLLALAGGAFGLLVNFWGMALVRKMFADILPVGSLRMDARMLVFTLLLSMLAPLFFGLLPALHGSKIDVNETLKSAGNVGRVGRGSHRLREWLVVVEMILAVALLGICGLFIGIWTTLARVKPGFDPKNMLTATLAAPQDAYPQPEDVRRLYQRLLARLEAVPGVERAAFVNQLPMNTGGGRPVLIDRGVSRPTQASAGEVMVSPGFFQAMRIPLLRGRALRDQDSTDTLALISESLARSGWPGQDPVGKRIKFLSDSSERPWIVVVGVVGDVTCEDRFGSPIPSVYRLFGQTPDRQVALVLRTVSPSSAAMAAVRQAVWEVDEEQPLADLQTMQQAVSAASSEYEGPSTIFGVLGGIALALAALGVYSVMSYFVAERIPEIGVRMALGARPGDVLRLVIRQGLTLALSGGVLGLVGAWVLERIAFHEIPEFHSSFDLVTINIALLLLIVALVACYLPARRAMKVDPMVALRYE